MGQKIGVNFIDLTEWESCSRENSCKSLHLQFNPSGKFWSRRALNRMHKNMGNSGFVTFSPLENTTYNTACEIYFMFCKMSHGAERT